jgi:hypothetical protein
MQKILSARRDISKYIHVIIIQCFRKITKPIQIPVPARLLKKPQLSKELRSRRIVIRLEQDAKEREGQAMTDAGRGERLQIMLSPEELTALDDFRFKNRMPSRAAAVRELLKRGLAGEGFDTAAYGAKSSDFGVTGATPTGRKSPA